MRFQLVKCNMMQLTKKLTHKIQFFYNLECTVLDNVESIKYLSVTITNDLKWTTHIINICTKANRTLGILGERTSHEVLFNLPRFQTLMSRPMHN